MAHPDKRYTDGQEREMAARYTGGATYAELMRDFGGCNSTLRKALRRQGITPRRRGNVERAFTADEMSQMISRWRAGESQTRIAQAFGAGQATVSRALRNAGVVVVARKQVGERHGMWKGGRTISSAGYVFVSMPVDHPLAVMRNSTGYVAEHRLVMAQSLGRPLRKGESVHHINGDKQDNRLENLQLRHGQHGNGVTACCASCGSTDIVFDRITED